MSKQTINLGTTPKDGTGTNLRAGGDAINDNFNEVYDRIPQTHYVANLTQTGTGDPTPFVYQNTLSGTPVWTRVGVGDYRCTLAGAFTSTNIWSIVGGRADVGGATFILRRLDDDTLKLTSFYDNNLTDTVLTGTSIEIRIYT